MIQYMHFVSNAIGLAFFAVALILAVSAVKNSSK